MFVLGFGALSLSACGAENNDTPSVQPTPDMMVVSDMEATPDMTMPDMASWDDMGGGVDMGGDMSVPPDMSEDMGGDDMGGDDMGGDDMGGEDMSEPRPRCTGTTSCQYVSEANLTCDQVAGCAVVEDSYCSAPQNIGPITCSMRGLGECEKDKACLLLTSGQNQVCTYNPQWCVNKRATCMLSSNDPNFCASNGSRKQCGGRPLVSCSDIESQGTCEDVEGCSWANDACSGGDVTFGCEVIDARYQCVVLGCEWR